MRAFWQAVSSVNGGKGGFPGIEETINKNDDQFS
tara:strand:- start:5 stop:106 length:102 start_codon:yes stop_codon:yes gene_type:complete